MDSKWTGPGPVFFCVVPFLRFLLPSHSRTTLAGLCMNAIAVMLFAPGCKTNTQIKTFLQERRRCVVLFFFFYLRYGVTALAREAFAIVLSGQLNQYLYTSVPAGTALLWCCLPWIRCSCMKARQRPRPARVVGAWPRPFDARASRPRAWSPPGVCGGSYHILHQIPHPPTGWDGPRVVASIHGQ